MTSKANANESLNIGDQRVHLQIGLTTQILNFGSSAILTKLEISIGFKKKAKIMNSQDVTINLRVNVDSADNHKVKKEINSKVRKHCNNRSMHGEEKGRRVNLNLEGR